MVRASVTTVNALPRRAAPLSRPVRSVLAAVNLSGYYGLALSSVGLLTNLGISLATDAFGPVADNAGGIAEMAGMPPETRDNTDVLDALGEASSASWEGGGRASPFHAAPHRAEQATPRPPSARASPWRRRC
jgi:Na+/H+-translocating membrane pyrophosphatase